MTVDAPRVTVVLAPNGLGHTRRTLGILARFSARGGRADITVVGERWQRERAAAWGSARALARAEIEWRHDLMEPGVALTNDASDYDDGRLVRWEDRLARADVLGSADVVVSDNLAGVLALRPDALLAGSFLWSDVLESIADDRSSVREFVEHERALLEAHRPEMICVADVAMPGVLLRTRARAVGWMCPGDELQPLLSPPGTAIGVLGGATGAAAEILGRCVETALGAGHRVMTGIEGIGRANAFDGSATAWNELAVVVCRPGIGTLTDAVHHLIPVVCVHEGGNIELAHNARRVQALGIGRSLEATAGPVDVLAAIDDLIAGAGRTSALAALARRDRFGLDEAADWLAVHCGTRLSPPPSAPNGSTQGETT